MKTFAISTERPYDIILERGGLKNLAAYIEERFPSPRKICVITDSNVSELYGDQVLSILEKGFFDAFKITFPAGEHSKNLTTYTNILEALSEEPVSRADLILALGGGVVGDVAGFVAGTYMRGLNYVYVPTTLLAMLDASLGGKTGVNLNGGKNLTGLFWQPSLVVTDPDLLETLPESHLMDGLVEALKSAVVSDSSLVNQVVDRNYDYIIERSLSIKKTLVEVDEKDEGLRQLLYFGHTLGHGIEKLSAYNLSHGASVAKGMVGEAKASFAMGYTGMDISKELAAVLEGMGYDTSLPYDSKELYRHSLVDKKIREGSINLIIPNVIGKCSTKRVSLLELEKFVRAAVDEEV